MPEAKVETPTPAAPEKKAPTPEEIEAQHKAVIDAFFRDPAAPKKEDKKPEPPAPPKVEDKKPDEKPTEPPPKVEPPPAPEKKVVPPEPELPKPAERKPAAEQPEVPRYTPAEQQLLAATAHLEKSFPDHYSNLQKRTEEFWKNRKVYRTKWETENPGKAFDETDEEHNDFYEKNDPNVDDTDLDWARGEITKTESKKEARAEATEVAATRALKDAEPKIMAAAANGVLAMVQESIPELIKEIAPGGAKLDKEFSQKLKDENPSTHSFLVEEGEELNTLLVEWKKLSEHGDAYKVNTRRVDRMKNSNRSISPHEEIFSFIEELENRIATQPPEETVDNGRRFLRAERYRQQENAIVDASTSEEEAQRKLSEFYGKYWKLEPGNIEEALVKRSVARVKSRIDQVEATYQKRSEKAKATAKVHDPPKKEEPKPPTGDGKSPEVISTSDNRDNLKQPVTEVPQKDRIISMMFP